MAVYFASDFHLGLDTDIPSKEREKMIVRWLDSILEDAEALYLLGDMFDYWFEYASVVPKGFVRILGKLAEFTNKDIPVHIFTGNHDLWMFGYLEEELGAKLHKHPIHTTINGLEFKIGHGDGLGPGDRGYKFIKNIFSNRLNQWLFARIHPNTGIAIMKWFSKRSRESETDVIDFMGPDKEWLIQYAEEELKSQYVDFFIFGHRHLPIDYTLSNGKTRYINTGDWIHHFSYARLENQNLELLKLK